MAPIGCSPLSSSSARRLKLSAHQSTCVSVNETEGQCDVLALSAREVDKKLYFLGTEVTCTTLALMNRLYSTLASLPSLSLKRDILGSGSTATAYKLLLLPQSFLPETESLVTVADGHLLECCVVDKYADVAMRCH